MTSLLSNAKRQSFCKALKKSSVHFKTLFSSEICAAKLSPTLLSRKGNSDSFPAPAGSHPHTEPRSCALLHWLPLSRPRDDAPHPTALPWGFTSCRRKPLCNPLHCSQPALNNRTEEQSRFFLERPISSSAYPALKTHCSRSTCVPHVFWGARTRLMRCSPSATGKCIVRITMVHTNRKHSLLQVPALQKKCQRQNLAYSPWR